MYATHYLIKTHTHTLTNLLANWKLNFTLLLIPRVRAQLMFDVRNTAKFHVVCNHQLAGLGG